MYYAVLSQIRTKGELETFLEEIKFLKESLYETKAGNFDKIISEKVRKSIAEPILNELLKEKIDRKSYLEGLAKEAEKFKFLKLTLAFEPTERTISRISEWVKTNVGQWILIDIDVDSSILGGAIVDYKGKYRDYSLRAILKADFEKNKENILNFIKSNT